MFMSQVNICGPQTVGQVKQFTKAVLGAKAEEAKAESSDDGSDDDMGFGLFD